MNINTTIAAIFAKTDEADAVRQELMGVGFREDEISLFCQETRQVFASRPADNLISWFGPQHEDCACLVVYAPPNRIERASRIIESRRPRAVRTQADAVAASRCNRG